MQIPTNYKRESVASLAAREILSIFDARYRAHPRTRRTGCITVVCKPTDHRSFREPYETEIYSRVEPSRCSTLQLVLSADSL